MNELEILQKSLREKFSQEEFPDFIFQITEGETENESWFLDCCKKGKSKLFLIVEWSPKTMNYSIESKCGIEKSFDSYDQTFEFICEQFK